MPPAAETPGQRASSPTYLTRPVESDLNPVEGVRSEQTTTNTTTEPNEPTRHNDGVGEESEEGVVPPPGLPRKFKRRATKTQQRNQRRRANRKKVCREECCQDEPAEDGVVPDLVGMKIQTRSGRKGIIIMHDPADKELEVKVKYLDQMEPIIIDLI